MLMRAGQLADNWFLDAMISPRLKKYLPLEKNSDLP
jgi:hypothetical protein